LSDSSVFLLGPLLFLLLFGEEVAAQAAGDFALATRVHGGRRDHPVEGGCGGRLGGAGEAEVGDGGGGAGDDVGEGGDDDGEFLLGGESGGGEGGGGRHWS